jgi:hypothetical protein
MYVNIHRDMILGPHHLLVLRQHQVIRAHGHAEDDGGHALEAVDPLLALGALAAHVHHLEGHVLDLKVILVDAFRGFPGQEDVLLAGKVVLKGTGRMREKVEEAS